MADLSNPTADQCEEVFHDALRTGDTKGVEAALTLLAVRDPRRAQTLMDHASATLRIAADLRDADPDLREAIADGDARFAALVDAYRQAEAEAGFGPAATELLAMLINDTDPSVVVVMCVATVVRAADRADRGQS